MRTIYQKHYPRRVLGMIRTWTRQHGEDLGRIKAGRLRCTDAPCKLDTPAGLRYLQWKHRDKYPEAYSEARASW